jgi:hypothetical protein
MPNTLDFKLGMITGAAVVVAGLLIGWYGAAVIIFVYEKIWHSS